MTFISQLNERTKKLDWMDMALIKASCIAFGILLAILIPRLVEINILWIIVIWLIFATRPLYRFFKQIR